MTIFHKATKQSYNYKGKTEYYWVLGDRKNPPVLILPGLSGTHSDLLEFSRNLRDDFFLILPDFPGWGDSPRLDTTLTLTHYAQYLKSLLESIRINRISIFGHCMGSTLAVEFTHLYPNQVKKLILVSLPFEDGRKSYTVIKYLTDVGSRTPHFLHPLFYFWENKYLNFLTGFFVMQFKSFHKKIRFNFRTFKKQNNQDWTDFDEIWANLIHFNYKKIREIRSPIHMISGAKDLIISKSQVLKLHTMVPEATLDFIEDAGHVAPVETPDTLANLTKKYLLLNH